MVFERTVKLKYSIKIGHGVLIFFFIIHIEFGSNLTSWGHDRVILFARLFGWEGGGGGNNWSEVFLPAALPYIAILWDFFA